MSDLYKRIVKYCADKHVSPSKMCLDIGCSKSLMSDLNSGRKQTLSSTTLQKISDYFGITVDDLLGEKKEPDPQTGSLSPTKQRLLDAVDDLTDSQIDRLLGIISEAKKLL